MAEGILGTDSNSVKRNHYRFCCQQCGHIEGPFAIGDLGSFEQAAERHANDKPNHRVQRWLLHADLEQLPPSGGDMKRRVPDTSFEVYKATKSTRAANVDMIWRVMLQVGKADAETVKNHLWLAGARLNIYEVRRRLSDLVKEGKIVDSGERKRNATGRKTIVWALRRKQWQGFLF